MSTASQVRSTIPERQGRRSSRSAMSDGPYHRVDRSRLLMILQGRRKPSCSALSAPQTTRAQTRSRLRSDVRPLYPRRCCVRRASELCQPPKMSVEQNPLRRCPGGNSRPLIAAPLGKTRAVARLDGCPLVFVDTCPL